MIEIFWVEHGQIWMFLVWWWDLKIDFIWWMNRWNGLFFYMLIQIHKNLKLVRSFLCGHGQTWVWPIWSWDSNINCISKVNWWNKLIFCMLVRNQESWNFIQRFLGRLSQKWPYPFSSLSNLLLILLLTLFPDFIVFFQQFTIHILCQIFYCYYCWLWPRFHDIFPTIH